MIEYNLDTEHSILRSARVPIAPVRNGEPSRTHSVLYRPIVVSHNALSSASPTVPTDGISPSSISVSP